MTVVDIRFRAEGEHIVLQVKDEGYSNSGYHWESNGTWRDAKVEDLLEVGNVIMHKPLVSLPTTRDIE